MDDIKGIISSIVKGSGKAGVKVSEVLAAFVARTVGLPSFLEEERVQFVINRNSCVL